MDTHSRLRRRLSVNMGVAAVVAAILLGLGALPAEAVTGSGWSRSTTGAYGSGFAYRDNGYIINWLTVKDTLADGDCAFVLTRFTGHYFDVYGASLPWLVGERRTTVCGNGSALQAYHYVSEPHFVGYQGVTVSTRVCRDRSWWPDNCSTTFNYYLSR
jgi:hypothetical protein